TCRRGEPRPEAERLGPADREERDAHADVQDTDRLVIDGSEPPDAFRRRETDPERYRRHLRLTRYAASASRSALERGTLGMSAPGLYRCGSASQPRMFATMFASVFSST